MSDFENNEMIDDDEFYGYRFKPFNHKNITKCYHDIEKGELKINELSKKYKLNTDMVRLLNVLHFYNKELERERSIKNGTLLEILDIYAEITKMRSLINKEVIT